MAVNPAAEPLVTSALLRLEELRNLVRRHAARTRAERDHEASAGVRAPRGG